MVTRLIRKSTLQKRLEEFTIPGYIWDKEAKELVRGRHKLPFFVGKFTGGFYISAEDENSDYFLDYYGEFHEPGWIHPKLIELAKKAGGYWDWNSPASIQFFED